MMRFILKYFCPLFFSTVLFGQADFSWSPELHPVFKIDALDPVLHGGQGKGFLKMPKHPLDETIPGRTQIEQPEESIRYELGAINSSTFASPFYSTDNDWSKQMAATVMKEWSAQDIDKSWPNWSYEMGVVLKGFEALWKNTGDATYFNYILHIMDYFVNSDGSIKTYKPDEYNMEQINNGKLVLLLYKVTGNEKYLKAAHLLREQLRNHPRTKEGGFWHNKIYPNQMWLDGLFMGGPFYAEYADLMHGAADFGDIANQFILMERHARDAKTGLFYQAWDETKEEPSSNKETSTSPLFWGRAIGWYAMALVDVLDWFPANHPQRKALVDLLNRLVIAVEKEQDPKTGLWLNVQHYDGPGKEKNYFEASSSSQFVYAIAKGVRKGYLPATKISIAQKGYDGIIKQFLKTEKGQTNLHGTVQGSRLGDNAYREGSFEYYMSEPVMVNSPVGEGAFLLASTVMDQLPTQSFGKNKTVLLDYYFNHETRKDQTGFVNQWHYTWEDKSNSGYAMLGDIFNRYGAKTASLSEAPTAKNLNKAAVYIIVDPDTDKESKKPNFVNTQDIKVIEQWVKAGGVLVLLSNDAGNVEFKNFNQLATTFGIQFNEDSKNKVLNDQFEQGAVLTPNDHEIFGSAKKLFIKELSTLQLQPPAKAVLTHENNQIMAVAKYGKGTVFALGDPWIYNEYLDGRKLPVEYENYAATEAWVKWLLKEGGKK